MDRPFGRCDNITGPMLAFLAVACAVSLPSDPTHLFAGQPPVKPNDKVPFAGKWDGKYKDHLGNKGQGVYEFREDADGRLTGKATWGKDEKMELKGRRLGRDAMQIEGKHGGTTYRYLGRMVNDNELVLYYLSIEEETGKSGSGESRLTRQKP